MVMERPGQDPRRPDPNTPPDTSPGQDDPERRRTENEPRDPTDPSRRGEPHAKRKSRIDPDNEGGSGEGSKLNQPGQSGNKDRERSGSTRSRKP
jgi:hypothetical protein